MTYEELEQLVQVELEAQWAGRTVLIFDNIAGPTGTAPWVRFYIEPTDSENMTLGQNPRINKEGLLTMDIFVPRSIGSRRAMQLADEYIAIMENREMGTTLFTYAGVANRIGDSTNGWYLVNVSINFQAT